MIYLCPNTPKSCNLPALSTLQTPVGSTLNIFTAKLHQEALTDLGPDRALHSMLPCTPSLRGENSGSLGLCNRTSETSSRIGSEKA